MGKSIEEQRNIIRNKETTLKEQRLNTKLSGRLFLDDFFVKGIYFLYLNNEIVYIGKSDCNVFKRICDHYADNSKIFDSFTFKQYNVSDKQLSCIERSLIHQHKPKYNIIHKRKTHQKSPVIIYNNPS